MKTFRALIDIRAECQADARELLDEFTGAETDIEIINICEVKK